MVMGSAGMRAVTLFALRCDQKTLSALRRRSQWQAKVSAAIAIDGFL
jgi:hypothetical protein